MKFSVLIANYNNGTYLNEAIQSVFLQSYKHWEIVIVDDKSTDDSGSIYDEYRDDKRIIISKNTINEGCGYTKRKCIELATGDMCGFLDPDDTLEPSALLTMVKAFRKFPEHSLIYSKMNLCDENMVFIKESEYNQEIPKGSSILKHSSGGAHHFAAFSRKKYLLTEGISPGLTRAVDMDLYYKLEEVGPIKFIPIGLYNYRQHANGISLFKNKRKAQYCHLLVMKKAMKRRRNINIPSLTREEFGQQQIWYWSGLAQDYFKDGLHSAGFLALFKGMLLLRWDKDLIIPKIFYSQLKKYSKQLLQLNVFIFA